MKKKTDNVHMARLGFVLAMVMFGAIGLFVRRIGLPSSTIALYRGLIAFATLSVLMLATGRLRKLGALRAYMGRVLLSGVAMGFNWILLFEAYRHTTVALATLCYYFMPTFVVLAGALFFGERLTARQGLFFIGATLGLLLIVGFGTGGHNDLVGFAYGIGAAALYATVVMLNRANAQVDGITRTWLQFLAAVLALLPYALATGGLSLAGTDTMGLVYLVMVGVVNTGLVYAMYFTVMPRLRAQQVAIMSYLDPLVAILLSVLYLHESLRPVQMLGGALLLLCTLTNELWGQRRQKATPAALTQASCDGTIQK